MTGGLNSLLIVKMSAIGDVIMTLPALSALKLKYPGALIDWLVEPASADLLVGNQDLNRLIVLPRPDIRRLVKRGRLAGASRIGAAYRRELRAVEYDVVLDLQGLLKSAAQVWMTRGRRKVGFDQTREKSYWVLNEKMPAYDPERHALLRYLDAAVYLGADRPEPPPANYYTPPQWARDAATEVIRPWAGLRPYLVLNPGAKWLTKRWPLEHWVELARRLGRAGCLMTVTGGPEDAPAAEAIAAAAPESVLNLCGRTPLPVLAAILAETALMITADTGPMHLAAAVGGRGLALFGPTRPNRTGPFGGHFQILTPPVDCLGCLNRQCSKPCLELLRPETVFERALDFGVPLH